MQAAHELARRAGIAETDYWRSWFAAVEDIPGNPFEVRTLSFQGITALVCEAIPRPEYNRVLGTCDGDADQLSHVVRFFHERHVPFRVDVIPDWCSDAVLDELDTMGFRPAEFQTVLASEPTRNVARLPRGIVVDPVVGESLEAFIHLFEQAYYGIGQPTRVQQFRAESIRARFGRPGWRFYVARAEGVPAAGAALHIEGDVATLAGGATLEAFRGRGCQSFLLQHRLHDAADAGCLLSVGRCRSGSTSQRNMERAGLRPAFTKTVWMHRWSWGARGITRTWTMPSSSNFAPKLDKTGS